MRILVTGGTGFIGRSLVQRLASQGKEIRLLVRSTSDLTGLKGERIHFCRGDVTDKESVRAAVDGCVRAFHLGAYARSWAIDPSLFFKVNVDGTKNVLDACLEKRVERVVMASTSVTLGPSTNPSHGEGDGRDENHFSTEYERSKFFAEKTALGYVAQGLQVVIVNPTRVYGPGKLTEANSVTRLVRTYLRQKTCLILGGGRELGNYVFVDDVVSGLLLAMAEGRPGERYVLGGENISLLGFYGLVRRLSRKTALRLFIPPGLALAVGRFEEWRAGHLGAHPLITREWVRSFLLDWAFSSEKAGLELGYHPASLEWGLRRTITWLNSGSRRHP